MQTKTDHAVQTILTHTHTNWKFGAASLTPEGVDIMARGLRVTQHVCHGLAESAGWWNRKLPAVPNEIKTLIGDVMLDNGYPVGGRMTIEEVKASVPEKLCLTHSELSEAMEGHRRGLMDDKLPHRPMLEVELADTIIRINDLAGALGLDLAGALIEKLAYNVTRADHKPEARAAEGGKAY